MKKLFLILLCLTMTVSYAQDDIISPEPVTVKEMPTLLSRIYDDAKDVASATGEKIEQGIDFIVDEGTIVVRQYIMFQIIKFGLLTALGFLLFFYVSNKIYLAFGKNKGEGIMFNDAIDNKKIDEFRMPDKLVLVLNRYYTNYFYGITVSLMRFTTMTAGIYLVYCNLLPFIKVTLFPKLYLVEAITKYLI